jgi:two-component sensor histidine kinase
MSEWPFVSYLGPIGALPTAPRLARGFVFVVLNGWGLPESVETLELIASELATNVVQAATGPDGHPRYDADGRLHLMWLRLLSDRDKIMLEVWDNLPETLGAPVQHHAGDDEESGRGLEMVEMLTEDWGWESVKGWTGKRVWALLSAIDKEDE